MSAQEGWGEGIHAPAPVLVNKPVARVELSLGSAAPGSAHEGSR